MKFRFGKTIVCAGCALSLLVTACSGTETATSVDLRQVSLEVITEKAKDEGQITSVGMPDDWANWKGSWAAIMSCVILFFMKDVASSRFC